jgi:FkbM family methyltransferase
MPKIKTFGSHLVNIELFPENPMIIDAGACQGNFMDDIYKWTAEPYFFAIEPNKSNAMVLCEKYKDDNVILIEAALVGSNEPKVMKFNEFEGLPEWGNVTGLYENRKHVTYKVETLDLKELLGMVPVEEIDLLKMDIEGNEHQVVQDMTKTQAKRIRQITMEVHNGLQGMMSKLKWLGYTTEFTNGELYAVR